jgi:hypothetical protein
MPVPQNETELVAMLKAIRDTTKELADEMAPIVDAPYATASDRTAALALVKINMNITNRLDDAITGVLQILANKQQTSVSLGDIVKDLAKS